MHGGFKTYVPVEAAPLPTNVRAAIHEMVRDGGSNIKVTKRGDAWHVTCDHVARRTFRVSDPDLERAA